MEHGRAAWPVVLGACHPCSPLPPPPSASITCASAASWAPAASEVIPLLIFIPVGAIWSVCDLISFAPLLAPGFRAHWLLVFLELFMFIPRRSSVLSSPWASSFSRPALVKTLAHSFTSGGLGSRLTLLVREGPHAHPAHCPVHTIDDRLHLPPSLSARFLSVTLPGGCLSLVHTGELQSKAFSACACRVLSTHQGPFLCSSGGVHLPALDSSPESVV